MTGRIRRRSVVSLGLVACLAGACSESRGEKVRKPVWAGRFYPREGKQLAEVVDEFLAEGRREVESEGKPIALVAPHAGYPYSGRCAGHAFAAVQGHSYRRVVVLAVNHRGPQFRGGSVLDVDAYRTPLGDVAVDKEACATLLEGRYFATRPAAHRQEHSLEVELPFLQRALESFRLVPVVVGRLDADDFAPMARELAQVVDDDTLVVVSCDFTHYGRNFGYAPFRANVRQNIEKLDKGAIEFILAGDEAGFWRYVQRTGATICGRCPVGLLLALLPGNATGKLVNYYTSGDATGTYERSVSYAAIVLTAPHQWKGAGEGAGEGETEQQGGEQDPAEPQAGLSPEGQRKLLDIARKTLEAVTAGKAVPDFEVDDAELQGRYGVFVTLEKKGRLRGCIGNFRPSTPLYRTVAAQARMSALQDRRFEPVKPEEVEDIDIEISILLPAQRIQDPLDWDFGTHGIIVRRGRRQATYLPQVAEHFDKEGRSEAQKKSVMLSNCCRKAGLPLYSWRDPQTSVFVYRAQVFAEREE
ncbi:MAG: AmmeMemoRadiSam system protein B [Candidatus Brocadiia bacterium]